MHLGRARRGERWAPGGRQMKRRFGFISSQSWYRTRAAGRRSNASTSCTSSRSEQKTPKCEMGSQLERARGEAGDADEDRMGARVSGLA